MIIIDGISPNVSIIDILPKCFFEIDLILKNMYYTHVDFKPLIQQIPFVIGCMNTCKYIPSFVL